MSNYYDRKGNPLTMMQWAARFENATKENDPKRVARTEFADGSWVSTVWLGLDHRFGGDGPPIIFETMVFPKDSMGELDSDRYCTEEEALAGHAAMVEKWKERRTRRSKRGRSPCPTAGTLTTRA